MDFLKNKISGHSGQTGNQTMTGQRSSGGGLNDRMGGGQTGEQNEDMLDKGVDMFQERILHKGPQNNESAIEQAKDEKISDGIRSAYKSATGKEFPVADK